MSAPDRLVTRDDDATAAAAAAAGAPPRLATHADAIAAHAFADSIAESVIERDRSGAAPHEDMARFDASGLLGITVPHAEGGPALGPSTLAEVTRVIAAVERAGRARDHPRPGPSHAGGPRRGGADPPVRA